MVDSSDTNDMSIANNDFHAIPKVVHESDHQQLNHWSNWKQFNLGVLDTGSAMLWSQISVQHHLQLFSFISYSIPPTICNGWNSFLSPYEPSIHQSDICIFVEFEIPVNNKWSLGIHCTKRHATSSLFAVMKRYHRRILASLSQSAHIKRGAMSFILLLKRLNDTF